MDYRSYDPKKTEELGDYLHFLHTNRKNYLVVQFDEEERYFETGMILHNALPCLLQVSFRQQKDCYELYYEISNRQSLEAIHRLRPYRFPELADYLKCLGSLLEVLDDYLLDADDLVLREEYVFVSYEGNRCDFLYLPGYGIPFHQQMKDLNDRIMQRLDHQDRRATRLIYELDRLFCLEHWNFEELRRILDPLSREEREERGKQEREQDRGTVPALSDLSEPASASGSPERSTGKGSKEKGALAGKNAGHERSWLQRLTGIGKQELVYDRPGQAEETYQTAPASRNSLGDRQPGAAFSKETLPQTAPGSGDPDMENTGLLQEEPFETPILLPIDPERRRIPIDREQVVIGSMKERTDFYLPDTHISRMHLRIFFENGSWYLMDQNSTNGTFLNENRLIPYEKYELKDRSRVRIADRDYTFRLPDGFSVSES